MAVFILPAAAAGQKMLSHYGSWEVWVDSENGQKICYMANRSPIKQEPLGKKIRRDSFFALVTDRPADHTKDVFSYVAGYKYKEHADAKAIIDGVVFPLSVQDDTAWSPDTPTDNKIIRAMSKGKTLTISGVSRRGTNTVDTFSLAGSAQAHEAISKECGQK